MPLRIEIGPRDLEKAQVMLVRRVDGVKATMAMAKLPVDLPVRLRLNTSPRLVMTTLWCRSCWKAFKHRC